MPRSSLHRRVKRTNRKVKRTNRKQNQTNRIHKRKIQYRTNRKQKRTNRKQNQRVNRRIKKKSYKKISGGENSIEWFTEIEKSNKEIKVEDEYKFKREKAMETLNFGLLNKRGKLTEALVNKKYNKTRAKGNFNKSFLQAKLFLNSAARNEGSGNMSVEDMRDANKKFYVDHDNFSKSPDNYTARQNLTLLSDADDQ